MPLPKSLTLLAAATLIAMPAVAQTPASATQSLMPLPSSLHVDSGLFVINPQFTVALTGASSPVLQSGVLRTLKQLEDKTGVPLPRTLDTPVSGRAALTVNVASAGPAIPTIDEDESYALTVTSSTITITAPTTLGALHALQTLLQLTQPSAGVGAYVIPAVTIQDSPRFRWRGLMIDCGRHFEPLDVLKRNIDAMAAVKLNVFHWHLTEDQGFRIQSLVYPRLTQLGSDGLFYTQDDARELVRYAADRGIRVVPEFEMPGHSSAWLVAYPELASGSNPSGIRRQFGVSDYVLDPTREETYTFIQKFLTEMAGIFPDQYIHIGGDEAPAPDWKSNPRILAFKKAHNLADNDALQAYFNQRVNKILATLHRRMVGWDEIFNPALPKDVVIQSWRGEASLAKAAQQGYQGVLSAPYYLDGMRPAGVHYLADPIPADTTLTPSQQKLILGGEVCMWAEQLDRHTIDSRIWPRTAAIAERFWSPQSDRDVNDMYRRLEPVSVALESLGLRHLSSEDAGLRGLVGSPYIDALRVFASALEPVSFGERYEQQHTSQLTPLTSFVDAVVPDPPIRHLVDYSTHVALDPNSTPQQIGPARLLLQRFFTTTAASVPAVEALFPIAPRLQPVAVRAGQLQALDTIGLQALQYLDQPAPPNWRQQSLATIEAAQKPSAIIRFHFLDSLTTLVNATK